MTPTALNLFFVQGMLSPEDSRGWEKFYNRTWARTNREDPEVRAKQLRGALEYREKNPEKIKQANTYQYQKNREENIERSARWTALNPEKRRARERRYRGPYINARRARDPLFRMLTNLRCRVKEALKSCGGGAKTRELIGCTIEELRAHLEKQFRPGMTWENYGKVWHLDHIRPCASFDLSDPAQQFECFNWSNCQPLFAAENLRKGNRV